MTLNLSSYQRPPDPAQILPAQRVLEQRARTVAGVEAVKVEAVLALELELGTATHVQRHMDAVATHRKHHNVQVGRNIGAA